MYTSSPRSSYFLSNGTATTEIYTLSLHDALPIFNPGGSSGYGVTDESHNIGLDVVYSDLGVGAVTKKDRKSTRLNSSHGYISYAVFCLKKKKVQQHAVELALLYQCRSSVAVIRSL